MNAIQLIENGHFAVVIPAWGNSVESNKVKDELLRLAKLGAAAEKAGFPCGPDDGGYDSDCIKTGCNWQDFCKLLRGDTVGGR